MDHSWTLHVAPLAYSEVFFGKKLARIRNNFFSFLKLTARRDAMTSQRDFMPSRRDRMPSRRDGTFLQRLFCLL